MSQHKNIRAIKSMRAPGVGNAIRFGLDNWQGDIVAICMADGSDSPLDLLKSYKLMEEKGVQCVFGSRFMEGSKVTNYPKIKLIYKKT